MDCDSSGRLDSARSGRVCEEDARQELERILSDPAFRCTDRNRRFLRFVAEELFRGNAGSVKAYTIAVDVFGRPASFDPSTDPIVRIEATRLRAALGRYYEMHGHHQPVRIELPRGHYVPVFSRIDAGQPTVAGPEPAPRASAISHLPRPSRLYPSVRTRWLSVSIGLAGGLLLGAVLLAFTWLDGPAPVFSQKPSLAIEMRPAAGLPDDDALAARDTLMVALSGFQTVRLSAQDMITASTGTKPDGGVAPAATGGRYRLTLKFDRDASETLLWWQIVDETSGEALRSGNERLAQGPDATSAPERLALRLAVRLASARGVINTLETAREFDSPTLGNGCVLRATLAVESFDAGALGEARACLETTVNLRQNDADALAMLAAVLLRIDPPDAPTALSEQALVLANRAAAIAPDSDKSFIAQMTAQFRSGNPEAAIVAGRHALELNPNNPRTAGKLAEILFVTGRWDEGAEIARNAQLQGMPSSDADTILAFDAYRRGEFGEALQLLKQMRSRDCYQMQLLEVATLGELGRSDEARTAIADLRASRPQFETSFHADLARRQFAPWLIAMLQSGLEKAGLRIV